MSNKSYSTKAITPAGNIMVGDFQNPFASSPHTPQFEQRVVKIVRRVHPELRVLAQDGIAKAGGSPSTARQSFLALVDHVEEVALQFYREGASSWSDARIVEEAMRRAPRLVDLELQKQIFETDSWFAPTEQRSTETVARVTGVHPQTSFFPLWLNDHLQQVPRSLRAHAVMLAWTQAGRGHLDYDSWRAMFASVGFTQDSRQEERPTEVPTLYRAANPGNERGWSWTTSLAFARHFQSMTNTHHVWKLEGVAPEAVLARYNSRGEAEWVIDMDKVDAEPVVVLAVRPATPARKSLPPVDATQKLAQFEQRNAAQKARRKLSKKARSVAA